MDKYLVDVPVKINIWIRPECQKQQFEIIKKAKPSILFIASDGGRNEKEWEAIRSNRKMIDEGIDWECEIYRMYEEKNLGMYTMGRKIHEWIWSKVDRCIFLEDDILPSVSFFRYCAELLEKYKDDLRVNVICGMNHLGVSENVTSDYFFSRQGSIWGCAMWRRTYEQYYDFAYGKDPYAMSLLKERIKHNRTFWKRIQTYATQELYEGHVAGDEYYYEFSMYGYNQLQIIPKKNMISNIGCTKDSAHADDLRLMPSGIRSVFNMKTYELDFPLKHAKYVIPDVGYEKKRNKIMAYNYPWRSRRYWIEKIWLKIRYGYWKEAVMTVINRARRVVKVEK